MEPTDIETPASSLIKIHNLGNLINKVVSSAIIAAALLVLAYLIWGGLDLIVSAGDKAHLESARNRITAALVGLAIVAAAWVIWRLVLYFLGVGEVGQGVIFKFGE